MRRPASVIVEAAARTWGVTVDDLRSRSRGPALDRAKQDAYLALRTELQWSYERIGQYMGGKAKPVVKRACDAAIARNDTVWTCADILRMRLNQLSGLSGAGIIHRVMERLDLQLSQAVVLAILTENYPRPLSLDGMCTLYDHAWHDLTGEVDRFVYEDTLKSTISKIRKAVESQGFPAPIVTMPGSGYMLSPDYAYWSMVNLGRPHEAPQARMTARC